MVLLIEESDYLVASTWLVCCSSWSRTRLILTLWTQWEPRLSTSQSGEKQVYTCRWKLSPISPTIIRWGSESIVKFILRNKGSEVLRVLDSGDRLGRTPLHYAASQKTGLSYITNLLKAGANIDYQDHSGVTPLHLACRFGNISLVRMLLDEGANKHLRDAQDMSPLDHAKEKVDWRSV